MTEYVKPILYRGQPVAILGAQTELALTGHAQGEQVTMEPYTGTDTQLWSLAPLVNEAPGFFKVTNYATKLVLDVAQVSADKGTRVHGWKNLLNQRNQHVQLTWMLDGGFQLRFRHSGQVLDVAAASTSAGAGVIQWPAHGGDNQRWVIGDALSTFETIALVSSHGKSLTAGEGGALSNTFDHIEPWERFKIHRIAGVGPVKFGDAIALEAHDGTFLTASPNGGLEHTVTHIKSWEHFTVTRPDGATDGRQWFTGMPFALRSAHGTYITAAPNGPVACSATSPRGWERWVSTWAVDQERLAVQSILRSRVGDTLTFTLDGVLCVLPSGAGDGAGPLMDLAAKVRAEIANVGNLQVNLDTWAEIVFLDLMGCTLDTLYALVSKATGRWLEDTFGGASRDQLYVVGGGRKIWPSGTYQEIHAGESVSVGKSVNFNQVSCVIELKEYDSGSADDLLARFTIPIAGHELVDGSTVRIILTETSVAEGSLYCITGAIHRG